MGRSPENLTESPAWKLEQIRREIEELTEKRKMLAHDLDAHKIPEIAQQIDEIDNELMQKRIEEEYLKGETE